MQNEYVIAALQLFSVVLIVALFAARIVQLRCELKEFKGWSWRKPGDNKNRVLMLLFWPVGVATCGFVVYWVVRRIVGISLLWADRAHDCTKKAGGSGAGSTVLGR